MGKGGNAKPNWLESWTADSAISTACGERGCRDSGARQRAFREWTRRCSVEISSWGHRRQVSNMPFALVKSSNRGSDIAEWAKQTCFVFEGHVRQLRQSRDTHVQSVREVRGCRNGPLKRQLAGEKGRGTDTQTADMTARGVCGLVKAAASALSTVSTVALPSCGMGRKVKRDGGGGAMDLNSGAGTERGGNLEMGEGGDDAVGMGDKCHVGSRQTPDAKISKGGGGEIATEKRRDAYCESKRTSACRADTVSSSTAMPCRTTQRRI